VGYNISKESTMRKMMWILAAIVLGTTEPAAQAQFGPRYGPRPIGPYGPGGFNRSNPLAPQVPQIPGLPSGYNPLHPPPFTGPSLSPQPWMSPTLQNIFRDAQIATAPWPNQDPVGLPGSPGGRQPGMPPTALDIIRQAQAGNPILGQGFGSWPNHDPLNFDPLASPRGQGPLNMGLPVPNVPLDRMPQPANLPPSVDLYKLDPKQFENRPLIPVRSIGEIDTRSPAQAVDSRPPAWFCWEYAAGVLLIATLAGTLYQIFRRDSLPE
jgi:hypothetical protein